MELLTRFELVIAFAFGKATDLNARFAWDEVTSLRKKRKTAPIGAILQYGAANQI